MLEKSAGEKLIELDKTLTEHNRAELSKSVASIPVDKAAFKNTATQRAEKERLFNLFCDYVAKNAEVTGIKTELTKLEEQKVGGAAGATS